MCQTDKGFTYGTDRMHNKETVTSVTKISTLITSHTGMAVPICCENVDASQ